MRSKKENQKVLKRILACIRPYAPLVVLSLALAVLTVALTLYVPILTGNAVDHIVGKGRFSGSRKNHRHHHFLHCDYGSSSMADEPYQ